MNVNASVAGSLVKLFWQERAIPNLIKRNDLIWKLRACIRQINAPLHTSFCIKEIQRNVITLGFFKWFSYWSTVFLWSVLASLHKPLSGHYTLSRGFGWTTTSQSESGGGGGLQEGQQWLKKDVCSAS